MFDIEIEPDEGTFRSEEVGVGDSSAISFSKVLEHTPIIPGSVTAIIGSLRGDDDGSGTFPGTDPYGTVNYTTGAITITGTAAALSGTVISATYRSWTPDARKVVDVGNVPVTFHVRNYDDSSVILVQASEDRIKWMTLYLGTIAQWNIEPIDRISTRFVRVMSTRQCRIFGSTINLQ